MSLIMNGPTKDDVTLCFMPLHHVFGQVHIMNATIFAGGSLVIQSGFEMEKALKAISRYRGHKDFSAGLPPISGCWGLKI